jgi:ATP-dependent RNA helicase DDX21
VFCQTKAEAHNLSQEKGKLQMKIEVMHGDIEQRTREKTLEGFKKNLFQVLVATDVASRGLDIPNVDLVLQIEPPN